MRDYPTDQTPGYLQSILTLPYEFRLVHVLRCMSQIRARGVLDEMARYYLSTRSTLRQKIGAYLTRRPLEADPGRNDLYEQCAQAQKRLNADGLGWCQHAMTLMVLGDDHKHLEKNVAGTMRALNQVSLIRERIGLKASFLSSIPGNWVHQKRLMLVNTEIFANTAPFTTIDPGPVRCDFLSDLTCQQDVPPLARFLSVYGTTVNFDPFVKQVAHALLVMPTGSGKTTFANFCLSQFTRYPDAQVYILDRDYSCRIITGLVGGTHVDLRSGNIKLNPMEALRDPSMGRLWSRDFLIARLHEGGFETTPDDRNSIDAVLKGLVESGNQELRISTVAHLLPGHLRSALQEWMTGGPLDMFDHAQDQLALSNWTTIEMGEITKNDRLARAFVDHAFHVIYKRLTGRPTFIYLEEASFLLTKPYFLDVLDDWLKTFRKKCAFVWMTMQSPQSITELDSKRIRATLTDNVPNLILGYNKRIEAHRGVYREFFGLTDEQVTMLSRLTPQRDYLRISDGNCRVMQTRLSQTQLAYLRSESPFQDLFDEARSQGGDWRQIYINKALERARR